MRAKLAHRPLGLTLLALHTMSVLLVSSALAQAPPFLLQWGTSGTGADQFDGPSGVAVDAGGNVCVADVHNNRIQMFGPLPTPTKATTWGRLKALYR